MRLKKCITAIAMAAAAVLVGAPVASANNDEENLMSMEACKVPYTSKFKFAIYYNSGLNGAYRDIGYSVYDFNALRIGGTDPSTHPLTFCDGHAGAGQHIKNNAASGENNHPTYMARVYYNSGYKGSQDVIGPYQQHDQFVNVYNEDASFKWTSS
ncbi:hypothetical protein [Streptomyces sp. NRRL F-5126]|uniref:hypothetical protein n=1 Tax=Streptomyces sp. NRRL F-5126 TaxID=1463857 RepID=UPI00099D059A|nr:hypothetical protein [Streptomyces sp. NRRL F-5126]